MPLVIIKGYKKGNTILFNSDDIKLVKKDKDGAENRHEILLKNLDASYYTLDTPEDILRAIKQAESESLEAEINGLKNTITSLTDWKDSMMKVHNELDLQGIAKSLGLPLGSSIAPQVLPEIIGLIERNKELVEMIEKVKEEIINAYNQGRKDFANYDPERHGNDFPDGESYYRTKYNHLKSNTNG